MTTEFEPIPGDEPEKKKNNTVIIIVAAVALVLCCFCIAISFGGWWIWENF
jgi:hypothetical protein